MGQPYCPTRPYTVPLSPLSLLTRIETLGRGASKTWHGHAGHVPHVELPLSPFFLSHGHRAPALHLTSLTLPMLAMVEEDGDHRRKTRAQNGIGMPMTSRVCTPQMPLATYRLATSSTPWTTSLRVEHRRVTTNPPDTRATTTRARRRRRRGRNPAADAPDIAAPRPS